jgi:hypothetical protein
LLGVPAEDSAGVLEAISDLERAALAVPRGAMAPPGVAVPLECTTRSRRSSSSTRRSGAWARRARLLEGRVWALHTMLGASLEQMTALPCAGAGTSGKAAHRSSSPSLPPAKSGGSACRSSRAGCSLITVPLRAVVPTDADSFAVAARAQEEPARESRRSRRRRHRREQAVVAEFAPPARVEATPSPEPDPPPAPAPVLAPPRARPPRTLATPPRKLAKPRVALTKKQMLLVAAIGLAVLVAVIAGVVLARRPITAMMVGHYALELTTSPAGARVSVDGKPVAGRTPLVLELAPGGHEVDVTYGEYANASFAVDGARATAAPKRSPGRARSAWRARTRPCASRSRSTTSRSAPRRCGVSRSRSAGIG